MTKTRPTSDAPVRLQALLAGMSVGDRLPGEHALAKMLGVSRPTVRSLLAGYVHRNILESRQGDGTYLRRSVGKPVEDRTSSVTQVGVIVRTMLRGWHPRAISAMQSDELARNLNLVFKSSDESAEREREHLLQLWRSGIKRIITFPATGNLFNRDYQKLIETLLASQVRIVSIDNPIFGVKVPCVSTDHVQAGHLATRTLLDHGHRSILIIGAFTQGGTTHRDRLNGHINAMQAAGLQVDPRHQLDIGPNVEHREAGYRVVKEYLDTHGLDFTAIIATRDELQWGAVRALSERNIQIPEEVSIIGFGDDFRDEAFGIFLDSLEHPLDAIAHRALQLLGDDAWDDAAEHRHLFPCRLRIRGSVKEARTAGASASPGAK